jgi:hypothetical protein
VSYRACYFRDTVLTAPEHANLDDAELIAEAIAEAIRADIVGNVDENDVNESRVSFATLRAGLEIGEWVPGGMAQKGEQQ